MNKYTPINYGLDNYKQPKEKGKVLSTKVSADDYLAYSVLAKHLAGSENSYGNMSQLVKKSLDEFLIRRGINKGRFMKLKELIDPDGDYDKEYMRFFLYRPLSPFHLKNC